MNVFKNFKIIQVILSTNTNKIKNQTKILCRDLEIKL